MYEEIARLKRSKTKLPILKQLVEPKTPTEVAKKLNLYQASVSRSILEMEKDGLVKCLTPNQRNFRHYQITKKGKQFTKGV